MTKAVKLPVALPDGWSAELAREDDDKVVFLKMPAPDYGIVTVDLSMRAFAFGMSHVRRPSEPTQYVGRNWKAMLFANAISELQKVYA